MIHFLPESFEASTASAYNDAIARLASIRTALIVAGQVAGIEADAPELPTNWPETSAARMRLLDARTVESAQGAVAGLEMLAAHRSAGTEPHPQSVAKLAETLRAELTDLNRLFSL